MLSDKQQRILDFIRSFSAERGYPPTIRDIAGGCHISSTSVVNYNLRILEREGCIRCDAGVSRGIRLVGETRKATVCVPIIGYIAAGEPIPVPSADTWSDVASAETLEVPREFVQGRDGVYALRVKGNSMIDALINDGDLVLMHQVTGVDDGDMVAIWLKAEGEVTLKKFYREENRIRLQPANSRMRHIYVEPENVDIQGRVICVVRQLT